MNIEFRARFLGVCEKVLNFLFKLSMMRDRVMLNFGSAVVHFFALSEAYRNLLYSRSFALSEDAHRRLERFMF